MKYTRRHIEGNTTIVGIDTQADKKKKNETRSNHISKRDMNLIFDDATKFVKQQNRLKEG